MSPAEAPEREEQSAEPKAIVPAAPKAIVPVEPKPLPAPAQPEPAQTQPEQPQKQPEQPQKQPEQVQQPQKQQQNRPKPQQPKGPQNQPNEKQILNTRVQQALSKAKFETQIISHCASLVAKTFGDPKVRQKVYLDLIKEYGQKKGLEVYQIVKPLL